jgi:hypothetical protein
VTELADMGQGCGTELGRDRLAADALWEAPAEAKSVLDELVADALRYRHSPELKRFLTFVRGFRQYKPFNGLLVDVQRPGSRYVLPASRWERQYGHRVKAGSTPLIILQPFGPVMFVHDVQDVEAMPGARPLPREVTDPFSVLTTTPGHVVAAAIQTLVANAVRDGVRVVRPRFGSRLVGRIRRDGQGSQRFQSKLRPPTHVDVPIRYTCEVDTEQAGVTAYATLTHELGHLYCGHLGTPNPRWWPDQSRQDHRTAEFEAEVVSAIAIARLDPTTAMPPYLQQHLDATPTIPERMNLERVMKAAGLIVEMTESRQGLRGA